MTTSLNDASPIKVNLSDPSQLIAAVPHLLGFHPRDSLVLIGHRAPDARLIGMVQRADLPTPDQERPLAEQVAAILLAHGQIAVTTVIVGGVDRKSAPESKPESNLPYRRLVRTLNSTLRKSGIPLSHTFWASDFQQNARWVCYQHSGCGGRLPDPQATPMALASAAAGIITFPSREDLERLLLPDDEAILQRRAQFFASEETGLTSDSEERMAKAYGEIRAALVCSSQGKLAFTDVRLAQLAKALAEPAVRDTCLATAVPPGEERSTQAENLWLYLARSFPAPESAEPATLVGYSAYQRGDGTFAGIAFEAALRANPHHVLAGLLARSLERGIPPRRLCGLGKSENVANLYSG